MLSSLLHCRRYAGSENDIFDFLELGQRNRKTASTDMNETSSRSHSIFMLELTQKRMDGTARVALLNLVDLAGSESVKKTNATGQTFDEAKKINLSLSALGNCIKALTEDGGGGGGRAHIPYVGFFLKLRTAHTHARTGPPRQMRTI